MAKTKYILSIDGGGMRGIIPAMILAEIEKRTNKQLTDMFQLMAGSSTGGLIVAALNRNSNPGLTAQNVVDFFKEHGPKIFSGQDGDQKGPKYSDKYLNSLLRENFKEETFIQTSRSILITSYDVYNNEPFMMNSWSEETRHIMIKDAVRATMAVPTLFLPKDLRPPRMDGRISRRRVLVSGSLLANNPAGYAYATAHKMWPDHKFTHLSLGTGRTGMNITEVDAEDFTKKDWIKPLRQLIFSSNYGINYLLSGIKESNYIRIEGSASKSSSDIHNASEKNIEALEQEATKTISENDEIINKFCSSVSGCVGNDPDTKTTN